MTIEEYVAEIRAIAASDRAVADESYWAPSVWREMFVNGLTPADAWTEEKHPALRAM